MWRTVKAGAAADCPEKWPEAGAITSSLYAYMNGTIMFFNRQRASKAAVEMLGRASAAEVGRHRRDRKRAVSGGIETPIAEVAFGGNELATQLVHTVFPAPLRQQITPDKVARGLAHGLQSRRARIMVPARWVPVSLLRGIVNAAK